MARKKKSAKSNRKRLFIGALLLVSALLVLVSLTTHAIIDDQRITGEIDPHLNPFEISYHNQGGMLGAYFAYVLFVVLGWLAYFIPLGVIFVSLRLFSSAMAVRFEAHSVLLFLISLLSTMIYDIHLVTGGGTEIIFPAGGLVAQKLTELSVKVLGGTGSNLVLLGAILVLLLLYTSVTPFLA
ncbi:MAG: DNA translocase FtsK 4TM domain-containing protein, partial [candidate division Zixibacteria bacterium]|nr:DNA translocase FtsK 4TM domain-containing protein [candidate division Zixibacteria bacterium]